jgi:predicted alpha/beta-hydrolase family hydrolase
VSVTHLLLAPGASGGVERLAPYRTGLRERGIEVTPVVLPHGAAERAVPAYRTAMERSEAPMATGGHSFGGRVASLLAAEQPPAALVLLSYPLHAPGRHDAWEARTAHWPGISCPVLLLSGEADPFARLDLLRQAVRRLPSATVRTWPRVGHGLGPVMPEAVDEIARFLSGVDS